MGDTPCQNAQRVAGIPQGASTEEKVRRLREKIGAGIAACKNAVDNWAPRNTQQLLKDLSKQATFASGLSAAAAQPELVIGFGTVAVTADAISQYLEPDIVGASEQALTSIMADQLSHVNPVVGPISELIANETLERTR